MSSYYLLPKGNIQLSDCFQIEYSESPCINTLSPSLTHYLYEVLNNERVNTDLFYKLQNDVHPYYHKIINNNKYSPECLELIEIIQTMNLNIYLDSVFTEDEKKRKMVLLQIFSFEQNININTKLPASFAFSSLRNSNNKYGVKYYNYTTYNLRNFERIYLNNAAKHHIIIANQQMQSNKEILMMICMTLCIQYKKGIFIWKIGDSYTHFFLEIIYFLSSFYERIYIIKPSIIDISQSYKYIVCKGFIHENSYSIYTYLYPLVKYMDTYMDPNMNQIYMDQNMNQKYIDPTYIDYPRYFSTTKYISSFLNITIPNFFLSKLEEVNYILGQSQLEQLHYLLLLWDKCKDGKIHNNHSIHEQKSIEWCRKHRLFI